MTKSILPIAVALALFGLTGCNNCEALTEKICDDLGPEDCQLWKEGKGPESLSSGRRAGRFCFNARFNPMQYSPLLTGAKAMAASMKQAKAQIKAAQTKAAQK